MTTDFDSKTELDFRNRLVAKFSIPKSPGKFWGSGFDQIPEAALYPKGDEILRLCDQLKSDLKYASPITETFGVTNDQFQSGDIGGFISQWAELERVLLTEARRISDRNVSVREAIRVLSRQGKLPNHLANNIQSIRKFRNNLVHKPSTVSPKSIGKWSQRLQQVAQQLELNGEWD